MVKLLKQAYLEDLIPNTTAQFRKDLYNNIMDNILKKTVNLKANIASAKCSCTRCESMYCFAKRHYCRSYTCESCKSKDSVINKIKHSHSSQIFAVYLNAAKSKPATSKPEEFNDNDLNYELDRNKLITYNQPPPKSLEEYVGGLFLKTPVDRHGNKPKSLSEYIDLISGKNTQALESYIKNLKGTTSFEPFLDTKLSVCKGNCKGKCVNKCQKHKDKNDPNISKHKDFEAVVRSIRLSCPNMDFNSANKKLIAEDNPADESSHESIYSIDNRIFKYDIFKKIKAAYDACTCKVCECIPTITIQNDVCTCKPCECLDCTSYMSRIKSHTVLKKRHGLKYTPSEYIRQNKRQTKQKSIECDCKPCDCALCQNIGSTKPCDCDQCNCEECEPTVTLTETPGGDKNQNTPCQCAPCDCIECVRGYITVSKNSLLKGSANKDIRVPCHCEICPNDMSAVGIESCKCERLNRLNKQGNRETQDFDLTLILNDIYHNSDGTNISQDMIAMYAAVPRIHNSGSNNNNAIPCSYKECECLTSVCKEDTINAIKSSQLFSCHKRQSISKENSSEFTNIFSCSPCECKICANSKYKKESFYQRQICSSNCDASCCSNNFSQSIKSCVAKSPKPNRRCEHCIGDGCVLDHRISNVLPVRRGDVLTPSAHQTKIQKLMLAKGNLSITNDTGNPKPLNNNLNPNISPNHEMYYSSKSNISHPIAVTSKASYTLRTVTKDKNKTGQIGIGYLESHNKCKIFKYDPYVQCQEWDKGNPVLKTSLTEKISECCISVYPSIESISKTSLCKEHDTATTVLDNQEKSVASSCYSSVYDHPRYLIRFPKSTAASCIEDVMKGDLVNDIQLNTFKRSLKNHNQSLPESESLQSSIFITTNPTTSFPTTVNIREMDNKNRNNSFIQGNIYYHYQKKTPKHLDVKYDKDATNLNSWKQINKASETIRSKKKYANSTPTVTYKSKQLNYVQDLNQARTARNAFTDYNVSDETLSEFVRDEDSSAKCKESSHIFFNYNINSLNIDIDEDYKSVKKTLKDANEFSMKLLKLLDKYEKANKEFKKISDTLKVSQASINKSYEFTQTQELFDDEAESSVGHTSAATHNRTKTPWSITDEAQMFSNDSLTDMTDNGSTHSGLCRFADLNKTISSLLLSNTVYEIPKKIDVMDKNNKMESQKPRFNFNNACHDNVKTQQCNKKPDIYVNMTRCGDNSYAKISPNTDVTRKEERMRKKNIKKYNNPPKRIFNVSKRVCLKKPNPNYTAQVPTKKQPNSVAEDQPCRDNEGIHTAKSNKKHELRLSMEILEPILGKTKNDAISISTYLTESPSENEIQLLEEELSMVTFPPSLDNTDDEYKYRKETAKFSCMNYLDFQESQELDKLIGDQRLFNDKEVSCRELASMDHLEDHVREMLNEFVVQPVGKEKSLQQSIKDKNSYILCCRSRSSLKVNNLLVRKVSDHTVLVKWGQPRNLADVQGYELLVDGRAVQKIFNPSKCIAVVTCLPHTEKILLTIRTVTSVTPKSEQFPATTIIYRPRVRCKKIMNQAAVY